MTNVTTNCTGCPVTEGTHKPADAVHTEIAEPSANGGHPVDDLCAAILRLPCKKPTLMAERSPENAYVLGHRDARHAAAELAATQEAEPSTLRARCAELEEDNAETARVLGAIHKKEIHDTWIPLVEELRARIAELEAKAQGVPEGYALVPKRPTAAMEKIFMEEAWEWWEVLAAAEAITEAEYEDLAAAPSPAVPAPQAALAAVPLPLLLRDIARDLGITVPQACIALKPLGNYSTNSAVTAEMARMLRDHFPAPAHPAEGVPAPVRDAEKLLRNEAARLERLYGAHGNNWYGFADEKKSHAEHLRIADALAATPAAPAALSDAEIIAAQEWARQTELESTLAAPAAEMRQRLDSKNLAEWADAGMGLAENIAMHVQFDCTIRADQARHALRAHLFSQQPAGVPAAAPYARDAATVTEYTIGEMRAVLTTSIGDTQKWAVRRHGRALSKAGAWEGEPQPSSRTDDFLVRCRFDSAQDAIDAAIAAQAKGEQA